MASTIRTEMIALRGEDQDCAARFLHRWENCHRYLIVDRCGDCGGDQPGSGRTHYEGAIFCAGRTCDVCSKRRMDRREEFIEGVFEKVNGVPCYQWSLLTITFPRSAGTNGRPAALRFVREKVRSIIDFSRKLWRKHLKHPGAGLFRTVECSYSGMLHVHAVYYGPPITKPALFSWCRGLDPTSGFVDVEPLTDPNDPERTNAAVRRAAKYAEKGGHKPPPRKGRARNVGEHFLDPTVEEEAYLADDALRPMPFDPVVAARFELASRNMHLAEVYGALRGHGPAERADNGDDLKPTERAPCVHCGSSKPFERAVRRTDGFLQECLHAGTLGLRRAPTTGPPPRLDALTAPRLVAHGGSAP